jgi:cell division ATPase FtsA
VELLNNKELQLGSVLIDLGFEKISFGLFKNLAIIHSITIPIGINHIAKDISKICSLDLEESVNIINNVNFLFNKGQYIFDENNYLKENYFKNSNFRKISKNLILDVVKARLDEIVEKLNKQLIVPGFKFSPSVGFAFHGGSNLHDIKKYFANFFGPDLKTLESNNTNKDEDLENNFVACQGAIKIIKDGWETEAIPEKVDKNIEKTGFFAKIFKFH